MFNRNIVKWYPSGKVEKWLPTTLDQLGKLEEFLEIAIADSPDLMMLESRRTGIRGPFVIFRQLQLPTPSGRLIFPDIVLLAASGHVIVVEVKRYINPELRDRAVIAQIIDYAASFAALSDLQCVELFASPPTQTWTSCVELLFPSDNAPEELANVLRERMRQGELNLVIACDKIPSGLPEVVAGIANQSALGFDLDLLEVVPYVRNLEDRDEILLVPSIRLSTEIVSRTAVTVVYRQGDEQPSTEVSTTSLSDIETQLKAARSRASGSGRAWTQDEVEAAFNDDAHPVTRKLLQFAKQHSDGGQIHSTAQKQNASFGLYVRGQRGRKFIFVCIIDQPTLMVMLHWAADISSQETAEMLREKLKSIFGRQVDLSGKVPRIELAAIDNHFQGFCDAILWFQRAALGNNVQS